MLSKGYNTAVTDTVLNDINFFGQTSGYIYSDIILRKFLISIYFYLICIH